MSNLKFGSPNLKFELKSRILWSKSQIWHSNSEFGSKFEISDFKFLAQILSKSINRIEYQKEIEDNNKKVKESEKREKEIAEGIIYGTIVE